ncbi:MAG: hypothetical protein GMKNLPBB_00385 [Myxococcota bacterium]|nr:hypothetical protein [Myxococcota bacterium]
MEIVSGVGVRQPDAILAGGHILVAYLKESGGQFTARVAAVRRNGKVVKDSLISPSGVNVKSVRLGWSGNEALAVFDDDSSGVLKVYAQRLTLLGDTVGTPFTTGDDVNRKTPVAAWDGCEWYVAWTKGNNLSTEDIQYVRFDRNLVPLDPAFVMATDTEFSVLPGAREPWLHRGAAGMFLLYEGLSDGGFQGLSQGMAPRTITTYKTVFLKRIECMRDAVCDQEFSASQTATIVAAGSNQQDKPSLTWNPVTRRYAVAWVESTGSNFDIKAQELNADTMAPIGSPKLLVNSGNPLTIRRHSFHANSRGEYGLAWQEEVSATPQVLFAVFKPNLTQLSTTVNLGSVNPYQDPALTWTGYNWGIAAIENGHPYLYVINGSTYAVSETYLAGGPTTFTLPDIAWGEGAFGIVYRVDNYFRFDARTAAGNRASFQDFNNFPSSTPMESSIAWNGKEFGIAYLVNRAGTYSLGFHRGFSNGTGSHVNVIFENNGNAIRSPTVEWAGDSWLLTWTEEIDTLFTVRIARLAPDGSIVQGPMSLNSVPGTAGIEGVLKSAPGKRPVIAWTRGDIGSGDVHVAPLGCPSPSGCSHECSNLGAACTGTDQVQTCGFFDGDVCREYSAPVTCPEFQFCFNGRCVSGS